jgi:hypothetical protein
MHAFSKKYSFSCGVKSRNKSKLGTCRQTLEPQFCPSRSKQSMGNVNLASKSHISSVLNSSYEMKVEVDDHGIVEGMK